MIHGIVPALSEAGKIKIGGLGAERTSNAGKKFRMPEKHDYFTVTTTRRSKAGDLEVDAELMAHLPRDPDGKCREIPIILHSDDIEEVFPSAYALYTGRKLACRGNGIEATRYEIKDGARTGGEKQVECPCSFLNATKGHICKPHATLRCSIAVRDRAVAGAVHMWRTTSLISIQRMVGSLQQIQSITGTLIGIPLVLRVQPVEVSPPGAKSSTVYCCHVELRAKDISQVQRQAIQSGQLRAAVRASVGRSLAELPAPGIGEDEDEEADIQQEFHPDAEPEEPIAAPKRAVAVEVETGELASDETMIAIHAMLDQIDANNGNGAGLAIVAATAGEVDLDALTVTQAAAITKALTLAIDEMFSDVTE